MRSDDLKHLSYEELVTLRDHLESRRGAPSSRTAVDSEAERASMIAELRSRGHGALAATKEDDGSARESRVRLDVSEQNARPGYGPLAVSKD